MPRFTLGLSEDDATGILPADGFCHRAIRSCQPRRLMLRPLATPVKIRSLRMPWSACPLAPADAGIIREHHPPLGIRLAPNRRIDAMTTRPTATGVPPPAVDGPVDDPSIEYPSSDGEPMAESDLQYVPLTETVSTLRTWFIDRPDVYIAGDMLVYYRMNDNRVRVAPDVFVVLGAGGNHPRDSWLVWREGRAPDLVIEIASPSTWERDAAQKRDIYAEMGVQEYWRFDPTGRCFTPALIAEVLTGGQYQPLEVTEGSGGTLRGHSAVLELDFQVENGLELRIYDPMTGERLRNHREEASARQSAEVELQREADARQSAEAARQSAEAENVRLREQLRQLQDRRT